MLSTVTCLEQWALWSSISYYSDVPYYTTVNNPKALLRITLYNPAVISNCKPTVQFMQRKQSAFLFSCSWLPELTHIKKKWLTFHSNFWSMSPNMLARGSESFIQEELLTGWSVCLKLHQIPATKQALYNRYPTPLFNWGLCRHRRSCSAAQWTGRQFCHYCCTCPDPNTCRLISISKQDCFCFTPWLKQHLQCRIEWNHPLAKALQGEQIQEWFSLRYEFTHLLLQKCHFRQCRKYRIVQVLHCSHHF